MALDLTFITNENTQTLKDRFHILIKDGRFFIEQQVTNELEQSLDSSQVENGVRAYGHTPLHASSTTHRPNRPTRRPTPAPGKQKLTAWSTSHTAWTKMTLP
jgi:hypothetical protein